MTIERKLAVGAVIAAGLVAIPASASATPSLSAPLAPCYQVLPGTAGATIPLSITGGTPGDDYDVQASYPNQAAGSAGDLSSMTPFDANGNATASLTDIEPSGDPIRPIEGRPVDLSVVDDNDSFPGGSMTTSLGTTLITTLALNFNVKPMSPRRGRGVQVSGTEFAGQKLYGFITNKKGTKLLRRWFLGTGNVCGYAEHKEIVAPKNFAEGSYRLYVNPGTKLNKPESVSVGFQVERF